MTMIDPTERGLPARIQIRNATGLPVDTEILDAETGEALTNVVAVDVRIGRHEMVIDLAVSFDVEHIEHFQYHIKHLDLSSW